MARYRRRARDRAAGAALTAASVSALLAGLLLAGAEDGRSVGEEAALATFDVVPAPRPAPPPRQAEAAMREAEGMAGRAAQRTPIVSPPPIVTVPQSVVVAAAVPDQGSAASGGAATAGEGTGAGRSGVGPGGGGTGAGGGGTRARLLSGVIRDRDYPRDARSARAEGSVTVRFIVAADGRARDCAVVRSGGHAALDEATCRLIEARFRYAPARDAGGAAISEERGWRQDWWLEGERRPLP